MYHQTFFMVINQHYISNNGPFLVSLNTTQSFLNRFESVSNTNEQCFIPHCHISSSQIKHFSTTDWQYLSVLIQNLWHSYNQKYLNSVFYRCTVSCIIWKYLYNEIEHWKYDMNRFGQKYETKLLQPSS